MPPGVGKTISAFGAQRFQANALAPVLEERHQFHPRALRDGNVSHPGGIEAHVCAVVGIELPELDEDRTAWSRPRRMR